MENRHDPGPLTIHILNYLVFTTLFVNKTTWKICLYFLSENYRIITVNFSSNTGKIIFQTCFITCPLLYLSGHYFPIWLLFTGHSEQTFIYHSTLSTNDIHSTLRWMLNECSCVTRVVIYNFHKNLKKFLTSTFKDMVHFYHSYFGLYLRIVATKRFTVWIIQEFPFICSLIQKLCLLYVFIKL